MLADLLLDVRSRVGDRARALSAACSFFAERARDRILDVPWALGRRVDSVRGRIHALALDLREGVLAVPAGLPDRVAVLISRGRVAAAGVLETAGTWWETISRRSRPGLG